MAAGDRHLGVVGAAAHELVDRRPGDGDELRAAGRGRVLDVGRRVADAVEEAVDLVVAERGAVLVGLEFGGEREVAGLPAHRAEQLFHRGARAGARVADVEALALQVGEGLDAGFLAHQHRERLRMEREHRAQLAEGALVLERAGALHRVVLPVGLRHAHVELAGPDGVDVVDRAARALDRAADAVGLAVLVDQAADRAARGVVHAGDAAGADGDELLLRHGHVGRGKRAGDGDGTKGTEQLGSFTHGYCSSLRWLTTFPAGKEPANRETLGALLRFART